MQKFGHDEGWKMASEKNTPVLGEHERSELGKLVLIAQRQSPFAKYSIRAEKAIQPYPEGAAKLI